MLVLTLALAHHAPGRAEVVRIGVLAFQGAERAVQQWSPTARYLSRAVSEYTFDIVPLDLNGMREAMASERIDFALTNPGNYVELEAEFGISRIATLRKRSGDQINTQFAAAVLVRADRDDITRVEDLRGKSFMAVSENAFGGFQMAWGLLRERSVDPFTDLAELHFAGFPQDQIVFAVRDKQVDAGTVRSDVLERLASEKLIELADFRVLDKRESDQFAPLHSTPLYPEWPFAKLRHTPRQLSQDVVVALLTLPENDPVALAANSAGWTIPLDYSAVHELFRELAIGPYAAVGEVTLIGALRALGPWLAGGAGVVLLMAIATVYVTRTNRRLAESDLALRREISERRETQEELARHRDTLEERVVERTDALARLNEELQADITARKKAEEALRRSDVALRELSETTGNPRLDHQQKIEQLLRAGMRYFDASAAFLIDTSRPETERAWHAIDENRTVRSLRPVAAFAAAAAGSGEALIQNDCRAMDGVGDTCRYVGVPVRVEEHMEAVLVFVSTGLVTDAFSAVDMDILQLMAQWIGREVERARAEEREAVHEAELNHVSRLSVMGEFATGLAHEINQPLTAIANYTRGCAHRLRSDLFDRNELLNAMELAVDEAERASAIVRHLREFLGGGEASTAPMAVNDSIDAVLRLAGPEARRRRITVTTDLDQHLPSILANAIQMEQVILNLLNNAIEAIAVTEAQERVIRLATGMDRDSVILTVSDSGPGLDETTIDRLFDPFFTTKHSGMGLGLSISRSIVAAYGGELVASNGTRGGATFRVILPAGGCP